MLPIDTPTDESMIRSITIYWYEEFIKVIENTDLIHEIINMYESYVKTFIKESKVWFIDLEDMPFEDFIDLLRDIDMMSIPCEIKIKI
jgi:hypothetical protein